MYKGTRSMPRRKVTGGVEKTTIKNFINYYYLNIHNIHAYKNLKNNGLSGAKMGIKRYIYKKEAVSYA
ncbi:hypothetical protein ACFL56_01260 [Candidatus Margulisiibacteriota bacterium]